MLSFAQDCAWHLWALLAFIVLFCTCCKKSSIPSAGSSASAESGPTKLWEFSAGKSLLTGAALDIDGNIFAGSNDGLYSISPQGTLRWKYAFSAMAAPPVVMSDLKICITGGYGQLQLINPDGTKAWDSQHAMIGFEGSPAVDAMGAVYLASTVSDLWAYQPTAQPPLLWNLNTERLGGYGLPGDASVGMHMKASPVIGLDGDLYIPRQNFLHRFTTQGTEKWHLPFGGGKMGPAALAADGTVYVGEPVSRGLFAVSTDGTLKWTFKAWVISSPVVDAQGVIYVCTSTGVVAVTPEGQMKWQYQTPDRPYSSPALAEDGTLYFGVFPGRLMAVTSEGKPKWTVSTHGMVYWAPVIGRDGTIIVTTDHGTVVAFKDSGSPLMHSSWPRYQHDSQNTGRM